ncbi:MAG TPA: zf-HC2 domain-containing protein [Acidimicrobiales bacterium]|nr:zf-HC2 domain-containing protein [Acidimicrobiales bacterium]
MTGREGASGSGHLSDALSALLDGELAAPAADAASAHLAACRACADEMAGVGEARAWLRALPPVEPPANFYARLTADPLADVVPLRRRRVGVAVLAVSAAASLAFLGLASPQEPATTPAVAQLVEAHATAAGSGDPVSQLVSAGVPVSFRR